MLLLLHQSLENSPSEADGSYFGKVYLSPHWIAGTQEELRLRLVKIKCCTSACSSAGLFAR